MDFDKGELKIKMQQEPMYKERINLRIGISHQVILS